MQSDSKTALKFYSRNWMKARECAFWIFLRRRNKKQDQRVSARSCEWHRDAPLTWLARRPSHAPGIRRGRSTKEATMRKTTAITCVFLDVGGVLLTDGWDHHARRRAAKHFKLDWTETEDRHNLNFATCEEGKLTLEEYLGRMVFYQKRPFTRAQLRPLMFAQSKPYPDMIELFGQLKVRYGLKTAVVSNEARELNAYRIRKFNLAGFVDAFISSYFVHIRKPDADIFRLALDIA